MRTVGVIAVWFGLGLVVTDLLALAMERVLATAPMHELLIDRGSASRPLVATMDFAARLPRRP